MDTIIELWNGNIAPCEHCGAYDPQINQLSGYLDRHRENLLAGLNDGQQAVFQKYLDCSEEYLLRMMELAFCDGYCLGSKLTRESLG